MQRLEVSGAVRPIYGSLGVKRLISPKSITTLAQSVCLFAAILYNVTSDLTLKCNARFLASGGVSGAHRRTYRVW